MKKIIVITLLVLCTLHSCAQKNSNNHNNNNNNVNHSKMHTNITSNNIVEKITAKVKHYKKEPRYFIRPTQTNCVFEVFVNGILVYEEYKLEQLASPKSINHAILESGPQTITVRMYPIGNLIAETYGSGNPVNTLQRNSNVTVKVVKYDAFNISDDLEDEIVVIEDKSPTNKTNEFVGDGLPYYEFTFGFNAKVPYKMEGWSKGEDLTKFNKEELEEAVVNFYKNYQNIYKNKDEDLLAKLFFGNYFVFSQAKYYNKKDIQEVWDEVTGNLYHKNKEYQPFNNYVMNFYGNNKLVALRHPSLEPVDSRLRGNSAFWYKHIVGNQIMVFFPGIFLHIPKGGTLKDLQRIP